MPNPIFHLYQLQKLDSRLDAINDRLKNISAFLQRDSRIRDAEALVNDKKSITTEHQKKLKKIEDSIHEKRMKIEQSESSLYGGSIKNPKELQDLQKEIDSLKNSILTLEDSELTEMFELENAENEVDITSKNLEKVTSEVFTGQSQLLAEKENLEKDARKLSQERPAIVNQIPSEEITLYEQLRIKKKGIAVSSIEDQCCSACGTMLTPAECQAAKSPSRYIHCASCGRLLYAG